MGLFPPAPGGGSGVDHGYKGKGVLIHLLVDSQGQPLAATSTSSKGDERRQVTTLIKKSGISPQLQNNYKRAMIIFEGDKGYDADWLRKEILDLGIFPLIPRRKMGKGNPNRPCNQLVKQFFNIKSVRWVVERTFSWLKRRYRRLMVRWERLQSTWEAFLATGLIMNWIQLLSG